MRTGDSIRSLLADGGALLAPGVWDPLSARLAVGAGFPVVFVSGFAVAATSLGAPDIGLLTQTEMADVARRVAAAVPGTPVVVDADTGYGDAVNAARTVELWEAAGAAGLFLEDQVWPKRCGHMEGKEVVPVEDWLAKLRAAVRTREHLHVTARTDARAVHGLDAAIDRARRAADVGVDALFVEAPASLDELARIADALAPTGLPLVANMVERGRTPLCSAHELAELGFRFVVSPLSGLFAAVAAARTAYAGLAADGTLRDALDGLAGFDELTAIVGLDEHLARRAAAAG
ncbi:MAG: isocitrate lyase/phosphoenolpyruvate mutase family protein [Acidimicrobiales bacterium]|jgi:2-methylisocitrate lyase-like PEP mutase family enzyme|nr:isocitrate lyase/phosphoenolpyruvate mutase family protein [Acidimicrobiales bacterium]